MGHHGKKWNRLEEAEDILDHIYLVLLKMPLADLRKEHVWIPSREYIEEIAEARDRVHRYMKRNKINGWKEGHDEAST